MRLKPVGDPIELARQDVEEILPIQRKRLGELLDDHPETWRVLDIGCGYHYPVVARLHGSVRRVCGVDIEPVFFRDGRLAAFRRLRAQRGLVRSAKAATTGYDYFRRYYAYVESRGGGTCQAE